MSEPERESDVVMVSCVLLMSYHTAVLYLILLIQIQSRAFLRPRETRGRSKSLQDVFKGKECEKETRTLRTMTRITQRRSAYDDVFLTEYDDLISSHVSSKAMCLLHLWFESITDHIALLAGFSLHARHRCLRNINNTETSFVCVSTFTERKPDKNFPPKVVFLD